MITADKIAPLRAQEIVSAETKQLKTKLAGLRRERQPFYLTEEELEEILQWKPGQ